MVAPVVQKGKKGKERAFERSSLCIKLPLAPPILPPSPQLPPSPRVAAPKIKAEESLEANANVSTENVRKREHGLMNDDNDDSGLFAASSSQGPAPKKQRLSQAAPRPRAAAKAKVAVKSEDDDRPEPRGQPEVWAEVPRLRTLPYTRLTDVLLDATGVVRVASLLSSISVGCLYLG